jgi:hypothetical protein
MSVGQAALAAGQVLLIVSGSLKNDYAVYVIASHVSRQQCMPLLKQLCSIGEVVGKQKNTKA